MNDIMVPDRESQFLLRPCRKCGGIGAGYLGEHGAVRVVCPDCGKKTAVYECRHDAQMVWNGLARAHRKKR